jgi:signal transduction histidine kinase/ActR/RegA family two-component response regulator
MNVPDMIAAVDRSRKRMFNLIYQLINRLSVSQKVMTVIGVEILSYSVITSIALYQIHVMGSEIRQMANLYIPLLSANASIQQYVQDERLHFKDVIFYGDRVVYDKDAEETYISARTDYAKANNSINELIGESERMVVDALAALGPSEAGILRTFAPTLLDKLTRIRSAQVATTDRVNEIFSHVEDGSFLMGMELVDDVNASEQVLRAELDSLEFELQELKAASLSYAASTEVNSSRMTVLASIATVCVVIGIFFFIIKRNISRPLHTLTDTIKTFDPMTPLEVRPEKFEQARLLSRGDELGMVARSLLDLKQTLRLQGQALHSAKEEAERANRAKTRFLAAASHDLRQPLHAMQMYIAALRQRVKDKSSIAIIDDIQAVSYATGRLLNSLLDVSQLEAGAIKPQLEVFAVQELMEKVAISVMPLVERKGLELKVVHTSAQVFSDQALMERILGNFLSNAIRYTKRGKILLGCRNRGNQISIQVWDTGVGVPEDQLSAIFEDFHQLQNDERDRSKGLGLGLAIVRRLAECLDHKLEVKSVLGRGSYFGVVATRGNAVELRALRDDRKESIEAVHDLSGLDVLLIEDDKVVAEATTLLLTSWRCNVHCARTTDEALDNVENGGLVPDIVLADYRLPGRLDGVEAIQRIQLALRMPVPGIIITGESDITAIREIEKMGYMILRKPVRPAKLRRLIGHYVGQSSGLPADVA